MEIVERASVPLYGQTPGGEEEERMGRWPEGAQTERVNWTVRKGARASIRSAVEGVEGLSEGGYVSTVIEQRRQEWEAALENARDLFERRQIRKILEQLESSTDFPKRPSDFVRPVLKDLGITHSCSDTTARALLILAREWWTGNAEIRKRL